jgi:hypothetical protein
MDFDMIQDKYYISRGVRCDEPFFNGSGFRDKFLELCPVITVHNDNDKAKANPVIIKGKEDLSVLLKKGGISRLLRYVDSSIWLRYAINNTSCDSFDSCTDSGEDCDEKCTLYKLFCEVKEFHRRKLYSTNKAIESQEFKTRLAKNSYLETPSNNGGGHGSFVAPFLFHSETEMYMKAEEERIKLGKKSTKPLKWRFLIIDDQATGESVKYKENNDQPRTLPKCQIIQSVLKPYFKIECNGGENGQCKGDCWEKCNEFAKDIEIHEGNKNVTIYLDCATSIEDNKENNTEGAISKIRKTKYDIILMDYLLGEEKWGDTPENRKYATDFLKKIKVFCEEDGEKDLDKEGGKIDWQKIKGPNGAFRIFFISAFTNAVIERMLAEGLGFTEDYWHISRGACPTTTPHLFSYYLIKAMNGQIKKMSDKSDGNIVITLLDLLDLIYKNPEEARATAIKNFNNLLRMRTRYDDLKYDACLDKEGHLIKANMRDQHKSKLVNSLFTDIEHYDNSLWEHVMHLVYLTAFGTIRQWQEMWEEYILIKPYLLRAYNECKASKKEVKEAGDSANPKGMEVIRKIAAYINNLRKQS